MARDCSLQVSNNNKDLIEMGWDVNAQDFEVVSYSTAGRRPIYNSYRTYLASEK